jgi:ribonuclease VapC
VILDTSALLAILLGEPEADDFIDRIGAAPIVGIGGPTLVESTIVLTARMGELGQRLLSQMVVRAGMVVIPFDSPHAQVAMDAWLRFGKGRHPAALNLGDCLAYATARLAGRPLLCKGDDFSRTDLALA